MKRILLISDLSQGIIIPDNEIYTQSTWSSLYKEGNNKGSWSTVNGSTPTAELSDTNGTTYAMKCTTNNNGSSKRTIFSFSVIGGKSYNFTYDWKRVAVSASRVRVIYTGFNSVSNPTATDNWSSIDHTYVATATATATISIYSSYDSSGLIGDVALFNRFSILEL